MEEKVSFWKTKRGKSIIQLLIGFAFMGLVYAYAISIPTPEVDESEKMKDENNEEILTYTKMQENLLKNNYEYKYRIVINDIIYLYEGEKDGINDSGFKTTSDSIIKYSIEDGIIYNIKTDGKEIMENLYENIDINFIDMNLLFNIVNNMEPQISEESGLSKYVYRNDNYEILVIVNKEDIEEINIIQGTNEYKLYFTNIGKVAKISID